MAEKTFRGGIHLPYFKDLSSGKEIERVPVPEEIIIPLKQSIGAACEPTVKPGEKVEAGDIVGDSEEFVSAPLHTGLPGVVKAIEPRITGTGSKIKSVIIKVDKNFSAAKPDKARNAEEVSKEEIIKAVRKAGIVGMGGAAFPTPVKLTPPDDKKVDTVIINGCECEPFLTCDYRVMLEKPKELLQGSKFLMQTMEADKCFIAIEENKMKAVNNLRKHNTFSNIDVLALPSIYPQGSEKQLIQAILDREVPEGGLPFDVGVLVQNVGTTVAIYDAVIYDKPLTERVVTVTGPNINKPANLLTWIGSPVKNLLEKCGGIKNKPARVVMGGPMTGTALSELDAPIVKSSLGLVVMTVEDSSLDVDDFRPCVRCERCIKACPIGLYPNYLSMAMEENNVVEAEKWDAMSCIECGICSYVCMSKRPIVYLIKKAKEKIQENKSD